MSAATRSGISSFHRRSISENLRALSSPMAREDDAGVSQSQPEQDDVEAWRALQEVLEERDP